MLKVVVGVKLYALMRGNKETVEMVLVGKVEVNEKMNVVQVTGLGKRFPGIPRQP